MPKWSLDAFKTVKSFASDNYAPAHPAVIEAITFVNEGDMPAYGDDDVTHEAKKLINQHLGGEVETYFVFNGTGANVAGLSNFLHPGAAVICSTQSHLNNDEGGAPERIAGVKLIDVPTPDAKLRPQMIEDVWQRVGDEHASQPVIVSLTQSTELGTVYTPQEMSELVEHTHQLGGLVHIDGARISNAAAHLQVDLADITTATGADLLSFGGTKNGLLGAEAVVFLSDCDTKYFPWIRKSLMQLSSKQRFIAAQFLALLTDDLWRENALHANSMAKRLSEGLAAVNQVQVTNQVQANAVFAVMPRPMIDQLLTEYRFYVWNEKSNLVRLMCSWNTSPDSVDAFIDSCARATA